MILVNTSFKSYVFSCGNSDMPLCGKWNVFVPYNSKAAGNLRKVAENAIKVNVKRNFYPPPLREQDKTVPLEANSIAHIPLESAFASAYFRVANAENNAQTR